MISHDTTDARKHQLIAAMGWYDQHAARAEDNDIDEEQKEMLNESEERNDELAWR